MSHPDILRSQCDRFDGGLFLRAQYTLPCDASDRRARWVVFAAVVLLVYALGGKKSTHDRVPRCSVIHGVCRTVPTLIFTVMFKHRRAIQKLGMALQQSNALNRTSLTLRQLASSKQARGSVSSLTVEMQWLLPKFEKFVSALSILLCVLRVLFT